MTEHEHLMYQVLGKISSTDAPIVFKGARNDQTSSASISCDLTS